MAIVVSKADDAHVPSEAKVKRVTHAIDVEAQEQSSCVKNGSVMSLVIVSYSCQS